MSDTLQEREDQMDIERINQIESKNADWCDDCHGYTHMPWCPAYKEPAANTPDIECQFCDFKGTFTEGAEHRKTTQHLIRTVVIGDLRRSQSSSEHRPAARGGGDETPERIWLTRKYGDRIWKPKAGVEAELQEYIRMDQHQSLVAERERLEVVRKQHEGIAKDYNFRTCACDYCAILNEQRSTSE